MSKKYGLILPNSKAGSSSSAPKADFSKPSIFGSDSDSDDPGPKKISAIGPGTTEKRQARRIQEKALKEDPTVFQYDELYDDIETKRDEEKKSKSSEVKKPKYIGRLLEYAERRKIENERRLERIVQKEREEEGEQFADKESFVTSAYRKKLEELKEAEEREKREDYLEAIGDVTKQQDLGGFYRHLYEQKLKTKEEKEEKPEAKPKSKSKSREPERDSSPNEVQQVKSSSKPRVYRKRKASDDENNSTPERKSGAERKAHLQSNLDADSDFSIDDSSSSSSSSSSSEDEANGDAVPKKKKSSHATNSSKATNNSSEVVVKQEPIEEESPRPANTTNDREESNEKEEVRLEDVKREKDEDEKDADKPKPDDVKKEKKVKKDIWKKRTVGEVFDAALQRFYERKALRNG